MTWLEWLGETYVIGFLVFCVMTLAEAARELALAVWTKLKSAPLLYRRLIGVSLYRCRACTCTRCRSKSLEYTALDEGRTNSKYTARRPHDHKQPGARLAEISKRSQKEALLGPAELYEALRAKSSQPERLDRST